ncbi:MAG: YlmC/YmxH family sporulation protein [Clostridia bacterium]|nr:YlmC/YmxH family sporulation protein [Clostridia bacterium]
MTCSVGSLCDKDVITVCDGMRIGTVTDVEFDTCTGCISAVVIGGRQGFFGVGKTEDVKICWSDIQVIGDDTILVKKQ